MVHGHFTYNKNNALENIKRKEKIAMNFIRNLVKKILYLFNISFYNI